MRNHNQKFKLAVLFLVLLVATKTLVYDWKLDLKISDSKNLTIMATNSSEFTVNKMNFTATETPTTHRSTSTSETATTEINQDFAKIKRTFLQYLISRLAGTIYPGVENFTEYVMVTTGRQPLMGHKAIRPDFGPVINDVTFFEYPIQIKPCEKSDKNDSLLTIVNSAPGNFERRQAIRQTWLRHLRSQPKDRHSNVSINLVGFAFVIGMTDNETIRKSIEEENKNYGDILQIKMIDYYYNLTVKVAGLMNWIHNSCPHVDFVLKTDDDVYVNVNNFAAALKSANRTDQVLFGTSANNLAQRDGSKWDISIQDWPWEYYPAYPTGNAVLIMGSTIEPLLAAAQTIPYLRFDDTFFWGLCAEKAGIQNKMASGRFYRVSMDFSPPPCDVFQTISWGVGSAEQSTSSQEAIENLYSNKTQCVMPWPTDTNRTINPSVEVYPSLY